MRRGGITMVLCIVLLAVSVAPADAKSARLRVSTAAPVSSGSSALFVLSGPRQRRCVLTGIGARRRVRVPSRVRLRVPVGTAVGTRRVVLRCGRHQATARVAIVSAATSPPTPPSGDRAPGDLGPYTAWAPVATATIHPGVQMMDRDLQCTANFVFYDAHHRLYIGQPGHCSEDVGSPRGTGCERKAMPLGTEVEIVGAEAVGELVYQSWQTMQDVGTVDDATCAYNDFALVAIAPADYGKVNPSVPSWGGPTALGNAPTLGETVYSYGNSALRPRDSALSPKQGVARQSSAWTTEVATATPGIPGDSGSGFLNGKGEAFGEVVTLGAGTNGVTNLQPALAFAKKFGGFDVKLAVGTEPFRPGPLG